MCEGIFLSTIGESVAERELDCSEWVVYYVRPAHLDHYLGSGRVPDPGGRAEGLGFMRARGDRPFTEEDRSVLHVVHLECPRLFGAPQPPKLAPRVQEAFNCLLRGAADKDIAAELSISPHTAREYVKSIFKAYRVSSRAELLAKCLAVRSRGFG